MQTQQHSNQPELHHMTDTITLIKYMTKDIADTLMTTRTTNMVMTDHIREMIRMIDIKQRASVEVDNIILIIISNMGQRKITIMIKVQRDILIGAKIIKAIQIFNLVDDHPKIIIRITIINSKKLETTTIVITIGLTWTTDI